MGCNYSYNTEMKETNIDNSSKGCDSCGKCGSSGQNKANINVNIDQSSSSSSKQESATNTVYQISILLVFILYSLLNFFRKQILKGKIEFLFLDLQMILCFDF